MIFFRTEVNVKDALKKKKKKKEIVYYQLVTIFVVNIVLDMEQI